MFGGIHDKLMGKEPFVQKEDVTGQMSMNPLVKLVARLWRIACGDARNREDENPPIGLWQFLCEILQAHTPRNWTQVSQQASNA